MQDQLSIGVRKWESYNSQPQPLRPDVSASSCLLWKFVISACGKVCSCLVAAAQEPAAARRPGAGSAPTEPPASGKRLQGSKAGCRQASVLIHVRTHSPPPPGNSRPVCPSRASEPKSYAFCCSQLLLLIKLLVFYPDFSQAAGSRSQAGPGASCVVGFGRRSPPVGNDEQLSKHGREKTMEGNYHRETRKHKAFANRVVHKASAGMKPILQA